MRTLCYIEDLDTFIHVCFWENKTNCESLRQNWMSSTKRMLMARCSSADFWCPGIAMRLQIAGNPKELEQEQWFSMILRKIWQNTVRQGRILFWDNFLTIRRRVDPESPENGCAEQAGSKRFQKRRGIYFWQKTLGWWGMWVHLSTRGSHYPARWTGDGLVGLVHGENASTIPLLSPSGKAHPCAIMNII